MSTEESLDLMDSLQLLASRQDATDWTCLQASRLLGYGPLVSQVGGITIKMVGRAVSLFLASERVVKGPKGAPLMHWTVRRFRKQAAHAGTLMVR